MGILNVTPDSFSDGGEFLGLDEAVSQGRRLIAEGADIIDIGGESTRPGAEPVGAEVESARVVPVIRALAGESDIALSIDTTKALVAERAVEAGAHIVNDVGGLGLDPRMAQVVANTGAGLVVMHMQGTPRTMQHAPTYDDLMGEIVQALGDSIEAGLSAGVEKQAIMVDPGIGFGKTLAHNWTILAELRHLDSLGCGILVGASRKRFLQALVGPERNDLEAATVATSVAAALGGAHVVRVHDVRAHASAMRVAGALMMRGLSARFAKQI